MIQKTLIRAITSSVLLCIAAPVFGQTVEILPLSQLKVVKHGIVFRDAVLETEGGGQITNNEIPQNLEFTLKFTEPWGFVPDTSGAVFPEIVYTIKSNLGEKYASDTLEFNNSFGNMKSLSVSLTMAETVKPGTLFTLAGQLKDGKSNRYTSFEYNFKVVKASKKLPTNLLSYSYSSSRGVKSSSYGLSFLSFQFGKEEEDKGNKFIYSTTNPKEIEFTLKGISGFKATEGIILPKYEVVIFDKMGNEVETAGSLEADVAGIKSDKKELVFKIKPKTELEKGEMYMFYLRLRDNNNPKNVLDLVLNLYIK